jgi:hypothetical protein
VSNSQVRATNTDVDDGVYPLAGVTLPLAAADLLGELLDVVEDLVDALDDALAINLHLLVGGVAKGNVVDCAVLGEVDLLTSEHVIAELLNASLLGELNEQLHSLLCDEVLGEVEQDLRVLGIVLERVAELLESLVRVSCVRRGAYRMLTWGSFLKYSFRTMSLPSFWWWS